MSVVTSLVSKAVSLGTAAATGGTSLLANWKLWAAIVLISAVGFFGIQSEYRESEVKTLQGQVVELHANLDAVNKVLADTRMADSIEAARQTARDTDTLSINTLVGKVNHADSSEDGAVAPVLRDMLAGLDGLRKQPARH